MHPPVVLRLRAAHGNHGCRRCQAAGHTETVPSRRATVLLPRTLMVVLGLVLLSTSCTLRPRGGAAPPAAHARVPAVAPTGPRPSAPSPSVPSPSVLSPTVPSPSPVPTWRIVALGDSVTSGGPCPCTPFPERYGRDLAQVRGVRTTTTNLGQGGQTSGGLLAELRDPRSPQAEAVRRADIDLVTIGANDFAGHHDDVTSGRCLDGAATACIGALLATMQRNVSATIDLIHRMRTGRPTAVLVTGYWNVFEDGAVARRRFPAAGRRATQRLTLLVNQALARASRQTGATYVGLYAPFEGPPTHGDPTPLLGPDGDHPNAAGQALIARRLVAAGLPGLVQG